MGTTSRELQNYSFFGDLPSQNNEPEYFFDSLGDLLDYGIKNFPAENSDNVKYFFRGECAFFKSLKPAAFREWGFLENEEEILKYVSSRVPQLFYHCKTTFDMLCEMAHYGFPTRLLDVSTNLAMAWFMAVDGMVFEKFIEAVCGKSVFIVPNIQVFRVPKSCEAYFDDDNVSVLSGLVRTPPFIFVEQILKSAQKDNVNYEDKDFNKESLGGDLLVHPKLDNPRIKKQSGAFILPGLTEKECNELRFGTWIFKRGELSNIPWENANFSPNKIVRCARLIPSSQYMLKNPINTSPQGNFDYSYVKSLQDWLRDFKERVFNELSLVGVGEAEAYEDDYHRQANVCKRIYGKK